MRRIIGERPYAPMMHSVGLARFGMRDGGRHKRKGSLSNDIQEGWRASLRYHRAGWPHPVVASAIPATHGWYANLGVDTSAAMGQDVGTVGSSASVIGNLEQREGQSMKIVIELEVDQEAYDRKYGPGTEWWGKYSQDTDPSDYHFAPDKAKANWDGLIKDLLTEGLYDWTQLHDDAVKIDIKFP